MPALQNSVSLGPPKLAGPQQTWLGPPQGWQVPKPEIPQLHPRSGPQSSVGWQCAPTPASGVAPSGPEPPLLLQALPKAISPSNAIPLPERVNRPLISKACIPRI
jgi:hypothetical protein